MHTEWLLCTSILAVGLVANPALSQTVNESTTAEPAAEQTIVVTGTRIVRDGFNAPTPVSVITGEEIDTAAPANIADYVNEIPALFGSNAPRNTNTFIGNSLGAANILNLRNLGTTRTLTLFNGRRVTPSFLNGTADVNTIPSALIERVDIVTGGASAAWGSDAVSGVVNFILNTRFTGIKAEIQGGESSRGDAGNWTVEGSYGTPFADGRGHFIVSGNYAESGRVVARDRGWFKGNKILPNPAFAPGNGEPARLILPNSSLLVNSGGLVASGPLRGLQFDANGDPMGTPFNFGTVDAGNLVSGGDTEDPASGFEVVSPLRQATIFARLSYDITDSVTIYAEGTYGDSQGFVTASPFFRTGNVNINIDNAYLDPSVVSEMIDADVSSIPLSGSYTRFGRPSAYNNRDLQRYTAGFESQFGSGWHINGYVQHGVADISNIAINNIRPALFNQASDAVFDDAGQIVCRSTLTNPGNGCVPINPFGTSEPTTAQRGYMFGKAVQTLKLREDVAAINVQGDLFELPAGKVSTAFGVEYRRESGKAQADPVSIANGYYVGNYKNFDGKFNVKEAFLEVAVPVLSDSAIGTLELNAAGRLTDYSTSGTVATWKFGASYQPVRDLTLRVTRSRDIRAPNLGELFTQGGTTVANVADPLNGNVTTTILQEVVGNPNLDPEIANTLTAGIVYQPNWAPGFSASVDFYRIEIEDAIFSPSAVQILTQCAAGDQTSCALTTRDGDGTLTRIQTAPINSRNEVAQGFDFEVGYRRQVGNIFSSQSATFDLRGLVNYVDTLYIDGLLGRINRVGEVGTNLGAAQGAPRFRGLITATYAAKPVTLRLKGRFISASKIESDYGPLDANLNDVPARFYVDAFVGHDFQFGGAQIQVFGAMDNVLNSNPPVVVTQDGINSVGPGTNLFVYDAIGRAWRLGARLRF